MRTFLQILLTIFIGALALGGFLGFIYLMTHTDVIRIVMGWAIVIAFCYGLGAFLIYIWNESNPDKQINLRKRKW